MFVRDTSARYRQTVLGYAWAFIPPIVTTATFVLLSRNGIIEGGETPIPYPAYVLIGALLWQVFAEAATSPIRAVAAAKGVLTRINFPREAILLSGLYEVVLNFSIRLLLLASVFAYYRIVPPATAVLAVVGVLAIVCLGFVIGLLLTPVSLLVTDITHALTMALSLWMLLTPVVYTSRSGRFFGALAHVNPVTPLLVVTRDWLTVGGAADLPAAATVFAVSVALLFVAWILYRVAMPLVIERIGN